MRDSIQYALDNHDEALNYAMQFARDMEPPLAEKFVGMYVNHYTVDAGDVIPRAAQKLLDMGFEAGLIPHRVNSRIHSLAEPSIRGEHVLLYRRSDANVSKFLGVGLLVCTCLSAHRI